MGRALLSILTLLMLSGGGLLISRLTPRTLKRIWLYLFVLVVTGGVTMMITCSFISRWGLRLDNSHDGLLSLMDGSAYRPFVFRRLGPEFVRLTTDLLQTRGPAAAIDSFLEKSGLPDIYIPLVPTRRTNIALHVAFMLVWLAWFGAIMVGAALLRTLRSCSWLEALLTATLAACLIPLTFGNGGYLYDPIELLLWSSLLLCATHGKLLPMIPLLIGLFVNKESSFAAIPALFPILSRRSGTNRAAAWVGLWSLVGFAWLLFVRMKFADRPGTAQQWFLGQNLAFWSQPGSYFRVGSMYCPGLLAPRGGNLAILALLGIPLRVGWSSTSRDIKWATSLVTLTMMAMFLISGLTDETRVLNPMFPLLLVIGSEGLSRMFAHDAKE